MVLPPRPRPLLVLLEAGAVALQVPPSDGRKETMTDPGPYATTCDEWEKARLETEVTPAFYADARRIGKSIDAIMGKTP